MIDEAYKTKLIEEAGKLQGMIEDFYRLPNCQRGGPLHSILDDVKFTDSDLICCYRKIYRESYSTSVKTFSVAILAQLMIWTEAERYAFLDLNDITLGIGKLVVCRDIDDYRLVDFTNRIY
jgi:hypothetical protein